MARQIEYTLYQGSTHDKKIKWDNTKSLIHKYHYLVTNFIFCLI